MVPIYIMNEGVGIEFKDFEDRMIRICNEHKEQNRALAFAFILYDFNNPNIRKILEDDVYWMDLHTTSGKYLTIFSLHYKNKQFKFKDFMTRVDTDGMLNINTNLLIERYFGKDMDVTYPSLLFFQVDKSTIIDSLIISLTEKDLENSFNELKEYVNTSITALKKITPENKINYQEIFDRLEEQLSRINTKKNIRRVKDKATPVISLLVTIKELLALIG